VTSFLVSTAGRDHAQIVERLRALAPPSASRRDRRGCWGPSKGVHQPGAEGRLQSEVAAAAGRGEYGRDGGGGRRQHPASTLARNCRGGCAIDALRASATASMGHTDATYAEAMHAIERGVTHVTHCFNAMRLPGHRDPACWAR
jgi:hypothetical protein